MTLEWYHELFLAQVEVLDEIGITIEDDTLVMEVAEQNRRAVPNDDDCSEARSQELTIRFIRGTNLHHKGYLRHLRNSYLDGTNNYPRTVHEHITSYGDARRMHWSKASKVMVCCLHKVGNGGTCQMCSAIGINKWDTTQTYQNFPTINQIQTRVESQARQIAREHHKVGM